jgi:hypothetical protein
LYCGRASRYHLDPQQTDLKACVKNKDLHRARHIRHQLQLLLDYREEEIEFEMCEGIFTHLESALKIIRDHGNSITLSVSTDANVKPLDHKRAMEQISQDSQDTLYDNFDTDRVRPTLHLLLVAAARSGCLIDGLKIESDTCDKEAHDFPDMETACKEDVLSTVKGFYMAMSRYNLVDHFEETVNILLQRTKNLVEFYLRVKRVGDTFVHIGDVDICARIIQSIQSRCLRKIELHEMVCRQKDILTLLENDSDTVKDLRLSEFILLGSWSVVMAWV